MISIIIPCYNQHDMSYECVERILSVSPEAHIEVIVIDNGSDPEIAVPFSGFYDLRVIRNHKNLGFPVAVNQGIRDAQGDVILLLNNDVILSEGAIERMLSWLEYFDIVGPCTNYCAGMQCVQLPVYQTVSEFENEAAMFAEDNADVAEEVNWIIGFCMMFKKSVFDEIGEFDESLWPCSGEEIDFCLRARKAGKTIGIARDVYVHHEGSQTFRAIQDAGQADYGVICKRNHEHLVDKWGADFWESQGVLENEVQ